MRAEHDAPVEHELKCWPPFYGEIAMGRKTFEVRLNDREFRMLDTLRLREWLPAKYEAERTRLLGEGYSREEAGEIAGDLAYSGREIAKRIGYILYAVDPAHADMEGRHAGIATGYVVMSLIPTIDESAAKREAWDRRLSDKRAADGLPPLGIGVGPDGKASR